MKRNFVEKSWTTFTGVLALPVILVLIAFASTAEEPSKLPFGPDEDLVSQSYAYLKKIGDSLASKADFDDVAKHRLQKDASTVAALSAAIGSYGKDNDPHRSGIAESVGFAQQLAKSNDFDSAKAVYDKLQICSAGHQPFRDAPPPDWKTIADLGLLMQQLPTINTSLKRGIGGDGKRFEDSLKQSAGQSATMAAIAEAISTDDSWTKNTDDIKRWKQFSDEMRDSAWAVNAAVHADDQAAATTATTRLAKTCEACHAVFRKDGK
jgi:hypothetical protein